MHAALRVEPQGHESCSQWTKIAQKDLVRTEADGDDKVGGSELHKHQGVKASEGLGMGAAKTITCQRSR